MNKQFTNIVFLLSIIYSVLSPLNCFSLPVSNSKPQEESSTPTTSRNHHHHGHQQQQHRERDERPSTHPKVQLTLASQPVVVDFPNLGTIRLPSRPTAEGSLSYIYKIPLSNDMYQSLLRIHPSSKLINQREKNRSGNSAFVLALKVPKVTPKMEKKFWDSLNLPVGISIENEITVLEKLGRLYDKKKLDDGRWVIAFQWEQGEPLDKWLASKNGVSEKNLKQIQNAVQKSYRELHHQRILHNDVHPGNVMIQESKPGLLGKALGANPYKATLIDFGLSAVAPDDYQGKIGPTDQAKVKDMFNGYQN